MFKTCVKSPFNLTMAFSSHVNRVKFLYKAILRLHRGLPTELQSLGNVYVKDEFKRHKNCNPTEAEEFFKQWTSYAMTLSQQVGVKGIVFQSSIGMTLDEQVLDQMRDDQIQQLYDLMQAATGTDVKNGVDSTTQKKS